MGQLNKAIDGIKIIPLKIFKDERGAVMHMIRNDSPHFKQFGEIYFSLTNPGVIKGWKRHKIMEQNFVVPSGNMKFVFKDMRENSPSYNTSQEIIIGVDHYALIQVPAMIWYCFTPVGNESAMIANCATIPHDPSESEVCPLETFHH